MCMWWWLWCQCLELASPPILFNYSPVCIWSPAEIKHDNNTDDDDKSNHIYSTYPIFRSLPLGKWWWRVYYQFDGDFPNHTIPNMCSANCVIPSLKAPTWHLPDRWSVGAFCSHVTQSANMVASVSDRCQWCNSTILAEIPINWQSVFHSIEISWMFLLSVVFTFDTSIKIYSDWQLGENLPMSNFITLPCPSHHPPLSVSSWSSSSRSSS